MHQSAAKAAEFPKPKPKPPPPPRPPRPPPATRAMRPPRQKEGSLCARLRCRSARAWGSCSLTLPRTRHDPPNSDLDPLTMLRKHANYR